MRLSVLLVARPGGQDVIDLPNASDGHHPVERECIRRYETRIVLYAFVVVGTNGETWNGNFLTGLSTVCQRPFDNTPMGCTPMKCKPMRCRPLRCAPMGRP